MRGSTNKSPIKLNAAEIKLTRWFVYKWRKLTWQNPHRVILRSPLLRIHYYQNKQLQVKESEYLIPTYSWTLTPIPNWICSVVTISYFQCTTLSMWLTNCTDPSMQLQSPTREGYWLQNFSVHHMMKIKKLIGHKNLIMLLGGQPIQLLMLFLDLV